MRDREQPSFFTLDLAPFFEGERGAGEIGVARFEWKTDVGQFLLDGRNERGLPEVETGWERQQIKTMVRTAADGDEQRVESCAGNVGSRAAILNEVDAVRRMAKRGAAGILTRRLTMSRCCRGGKKEKRIGCGPVPENSGDRSSQHRVRGGWNLGHRMVKVGTEK